MKYRALALLPFGLALLFAVASALLGPNMSPALTFTNEAGKVLALMGAVLAASAFERGEYLNRAWITYGSCYLLLLVNDGLGMTSGDAESLVLVRGLVVALANGCSVVGTWMLARAWSVAGLGDEGQGATRRRLVFAGTTVLALVITGVPLTHDVRDLLAGHGIAIVSIASDLGDTLTLALVAPVMQTALAMRGGLLRWPWGFLTASGLAWIVYDWTSSTLLQHHGAPGMALVASESLRVLANGYFFAAGASQRLALSADEHQQEAGPV